MNAKNALAATNRKSRTIRFVSDPSLFFLALTLLVILIIYPDKVSQSIREALLRCVGSLIPVLFPISVLSSLLASLKASDLLRKALGSPVSIIFGVSKNSAPAVILGMLCGFPVGAAYARTLYERSCISKAEYEKLISVSSLPSPAFVLNVLGKSMLKCRLSGFLVLACVLLSNITVSQLFRSKEEKLSVMPRKEKQNLGASVSKALTNAASAMLNIVACVVFFSALTSLIPDKTPPAVKAFISGVLEFSQGCKNAVDTYSVNALPFCAAFLSYGGLSVNFQIMSVCGNEISYKKYFLISVLRALVSFLLSFAVNIIIFDI